MRFFASFVVVVVVFVAVAGCASVAVKDDGFVDGLSADRALLLVQRSDPAASDFVWLRRSQVTATGGFALPRDAAGRDGGQVVFLRPQHGDVIEDRWVVGVVRHSVGGVIVDDGVSLNDIAAFAAFGARIGPVDSIGVAGDEFIVVYSKDCGVHVVVAYEDGAVVEHTREEAGCGGVVGSVDYERWKQRHDEPWGHSSSGTSP